MVPRETGNNAFASKVWRDKQGIMVFLILANVAEREARAAIAERETRGRKNIKAPANEETLFPEMFPRRANEETFAEETKCC